MQIVIKTRHCHAPMATVQSVDSAESAGQIQVHTWEAIAEALYGIAAEVQRTGYSRQVIIDVSPTV